MSQRHKLWEQGTTAAGEIHAQGMVAPGIAMQVNPEAMNELTAGPPSFNMGLEPKEDLASVEVPMGPAGGPLQGSSLTGAIPEELGPGPGPGPGPDPNPDPDAPTITNLTPGTAVIGGADVTMTVTGTKFTDASVITFNGGDETTTFVSETELTTVVKPSTATVAGDFPVTVKDGDKESTPMNFVFTEAETPEGEERTFPMGPYNIVQIRYDDELGQLIFQLDPAASGAVENGDTILVEATGATAVNGTYTAENVAGPEFSVTMASTPLTAVIDNKGRATVTGGE